MKQNCKDVKNYGTIFKGCYIIYIYIYVVASKRNEALGIGNFRHKIFITNR